MCDFSLHALETCRLNGSVVGNTTAYHPWVQVLVQLKLGKLVSYMPGQLVYTSFFHPIKKLS